MVIKSVSRHFTEVTGYESEEAVMSNLNMIMPKLIAKSHKEMVIHMSKCGKFNDENVYSISRVYILNKEGFIVPVLKIYKEFVTIEGNL